MYSILSLVDENGEIHGSGQGAGRQVSCSDPCCACSLTLDPFTVEISGLWQAGYFSIEMDPEYTMEQYFTSCCAGGAPGGGRIYQLDLCKCPTGLPLEFTVEARDGAGRDIECTLPLNASTKVEGWVTLHRKEP